MSRAVPVVQRVPLRGRIGGAPPRLPPTCVLGVSFCEDHAPRTGVDGTEAAPPRRRPCTSLGSLTCLLKGSSTTLRHDSGCHEVSPRLPLGGSGRSPVRRVGLPGVRLLRIGDQGHVRRRSRPWRGGRATARPSTTRRASRPWGAPRSWARCGSRCRERAGGRAGGAPPEEAAHRRSPRAGVGTSRGGKGSAASRSVCGRVDGTCAGT